MPCLPPGDLAARPLAGPANGHCPRVKFLEPAARTTDFSDADPATQARYQAAIGLAIDTGTESMTSVLTATPAAVSPDFLVFLPLYARAAPVMTVAERRAALQGLLFARGKLDQLLAGTTRSLPPDFHIRVAEAAQAPASPAILYESDKASAWPLPARSYPAPQQLTVFNHPVLLYISGPVLSLTSPTHFYPLLVVLTGSLISLLLARLHWHQLRQHRMTEQKVDAVTAELNEKERLVAGIYDMSPLAIALFDLAGNFISTNPAFERLFGYNAQEAKNLNYWGLSLEHYHTVETQQMASPDNQFPPREKEFLHKAGYLIPIALNGMRLTGADGSQYICCLMEDITERKQTLKQLAESQAFSVCVLDSLPANIAVLDDDGAILAVNEAWRQFGKQNGASSALVNPVGMPYLDSYRCETVDEDMARVVDGLQSVLSRERDYFSIDYPCDSPQEKRWFHMTVTRLIAPAQGVVISHADISKVKQLQIDQHKADVLLLSAIDAIGEAFVLYDADDRLVLCNQKYKDVYALSADKIQPGNSFEEILRLGAIRGEYADATEPIEDWIQQRLATHRQNEAEITQRLSSGRILRIIEHRTPTGHTVGVRFDITELVQATEAANQATRAKSAFLAIMSHEIRTPMNAVLGLLQLLALTELNAQLADLIHETRQSARSMLRLLNDILDFSRLESNRTPLELQPFALDDLMRELSTVMSTQLEGKPIELLFDIDAGAPNLLIGDVLRLKQILFNLCNNAVKFTAQGDVLIEVKLMGRSAGGAELRFAVHDTGIGIAPENQETIFSAFAQAESSITRRFGGTGLGLSISRRLVELMGGRITLDSVPGQGSTFSFTVALQTPEDTLAEPNPRTDAAPAVRHLLLVDDHPLARQLEQAMAESLGWQTDVASSGEQAVAMIEERSRRGQAPYRAILLDEEMTGMDGWETSRRIHEASTPAPAPVMIMLATHPRRALSKRAEPDLALLKDYLIKPVTAAMLSQALTKAFSGQRRVRLQPRTAEARPARLQGLRLLVVEDNPLNQRVMRELLLTEGAEVELADNGELGVTAIAQAARPFDAVLMDLQMPVMDGYSATRVIRHEMGLTALPVIALSANSSLQDRQACLAEGMSDHVGKPFEMEHLVRVLLTHTGRGTAFGGDAPVAPVTPVTPVTPTLAQSPVVLDDSALQRLGSNPAMLADLLRAFLDEIVSLPDQLDERLKANDRKGAAHMVHTLIGSAGLLGANHLADVARQTKDALKDTTARPAEAALSAEFRDAVVLTSHALGAWLAQRAQDDG